MTLLASVWGSALLVAPLPAWLTQGIPQAPSLPGPPPLYPALSHACPPYAFPGQVSGLMGSALFLHQVPLC